MRIAIMQPTYLPWAGYFDLMDQVDCFVLLDDVQFSRQSWQQRNRIKGRNGSQWLTVPVRRGGDARMIDQVKIDDTVPWRRKHRDAILQAYAGCPGLAGLLDFLDQSFGRPWLMLAELNIYFITALKERLGIGTPLLRASDQPVKAGRIDRLVTWCLELGADEYLSPIGAHDYLGAGETLQRAGIRLRYQGYQSQPYSQKYPPFVPSLSVLDLMLNEGPRSIEVIRRGRCQPLIPAQLAARLPGATA